MSSDDLLALECFEDASRSLFRFDDLCDDIFCELAAEAEISMAPIAKQSSTALAKSFYHGYVFCNETKILH